MLRIAITLPGFVPGEASFIVRLLDETFDRVHIRKPDADALAVAKLIEGVPKAYRGRSSCTTTMRLRNAMDWEASI